MQTGLATRIVKGGLIAPLAYGALADWAGIGTTMTVIGCVVLLTLPLCLILGPALSELRRLKPAE